VRHLALFGALLALALVCGTARADTFAVVPPAAARYRAAAKTASVGFHGSATPSPFASTPQRSQVLGMNCIQPIAPAELGPMLRPKFDSILLIDASTCHGIP
jgi:hypothetical protein